MTTLVKDVKITGNGLHSGRPINMLIKPSKTPGIRFFRSDLGGGEIPALYNNVGEAKFRNTTVGEKPFCVQTIEHLMATFFVCGIDSADIEIDNIEVPILDGSASEFCKIIMAAGKTGKPTLPKIIVRRTVVAHQKEIFATLPILARIKWTILNFIRGKKQDGFVKLSPDAAGLNIKATLVYPEPVIGTQSQEFLFDYTKSAQDNFMNNFASARTFGKISEWEYLKKRKMARGANENNVIALNETGNSTINKLYWPDEFVRHKIIDAVGDMFTSGGYIYGKIESYKGSHAMNNLVLRKLFSDKRNYDIIRDI